MRVLIKYSRDNSAKFLSHLDMQRFFARALMRSGLKCRFSEGFNPHIIMSFASPLSVGYATMGDYLEVKLEDEQRADDIMTKLAAVMPEDIKIVSVGLISDKCPKLMAINHSASYVVEFEQNIEKEAEKLKQVKEYKITDRKGRDIDILPMIISIEPKGNKILCSLKNSSQTTLNPGNLIQVFTNNAKNVKITRIDCYCDLKGEVMPFDKLTEVV